MLDDAEVEAETDSDGWEDMPETERTPPEIICPEGIEVPVGC